MISIEILEDHDIVEPHMLCRPLFLSYADSGSIFTEAEYGGSPTNNLKWVPVRVVLGPPWWGKSLLVIREACHWNYEVIDSPLALPSRHLLNYDRSKAW